ncbi:SusD/RagB family nutrient-binding outer membrane lipoprotein [Chitinophaga sp. sic0106]|uniref:SusD/RagB family nutrient-binding outer membrane lipoprotein n=1 Tax=Chitinophaga sp. sic0106 TaxID=2854785 RepID=UPI001C45DDB9|nr:SusD/RagB family nutrient-binding outer membrane lipoprotein [Chitinophaga sp. sic0106]MBV7531109.1 SusD/RagB family nutrient-binding outer membrane lipoprotein [Chitinophaga sp. sic0106]
MKRLYIFLLLLSTGYGCTKDFSSLNTDPTQFTAVAPEASMLAAVKNLNTRLADYNTTKYWDLGHLLCQQANRYDVTDQGMWQTMFQGVLGNLNQVLVNYGADSIYNNRVQVTRILHAYTYSILAGTYGPVPLYQANNPEYLSTIAFDNEDTVYTYVMNTLKDAASKINLNGDKLKYDAIYNGNLQYWVKFANTLRLKIGLRIQRNLPDLAATHIREVMASDALCINAEAETAKMLFENVNNNESPYFIKYIKSNQYFPYAPNATNQAPKLSEFLFTFFRSYKDPRMMVYYDSVPLANRLLLQDTLSSTADDSLRIVTYPIPYLGLAKANTKLAGWSSLGGLPDVIGGSNINAFSNANPVILQPGRPFVMLSYAEALFLKAEAAQTGYGGARSAEQYYYSGIDANFAYWNISNVLRDEYKNRDGIKWGTTGVGYSNYLSVTNTDIPADGNAKIWMQRWLNYFPDGGFDCWTLERQTRVFHLPPHTNPGGYSSYSPNPTYSDVPGRASYPMSVVNLNPVGYQGAIREMGAARGDDYDIYQSLHFAKPYQVPEWDKVDARYDYRLIQKWYGSTIEELKVAAATGGFRYTVIQTYRP